MIKRPFRLGSLTLPSNVFCAPLAGCSDLPFRRMTSAFRPGLIFCEMVKMEPLVRGNAGTQRLLDYEAGMHPIGAQLCGSKKELAGPSAKIIEDLGFDVVDLNCGCPVDKVTKDGSGSGMLKTPELIGEVIANMVAAVRIPVTLKIRTGWDAHHINAVEITRIAEQAGATAICIHGRTRAQGYAGPADWEHIRACKQAAQRIPVIGNGDIVDAPSALRMLEYTGCDAVLIARGTMGQPWIVDDVYRLAAGEPPVQRSSSDRRDALLQHLEHVVSYQNEVKALLDLRRICCWYIKNVHLAKRLRDAIVHAQSLQEVRLLIEEYPWNDGDESHSERECAGSGAEGCC